MARLDPGVVVAVGSYATLVGSGALWADGADSTYAHAHTPAGATANGYHYASLPTVEGVTTATVTARVSSDSPSEAPTLVNAFIEQDPPNLYAFAEHEIPVSGATVTEITFTLAPAGGFPLASVFEAPCHIAFGTGILRDAFQCVKVHAAWVNVNAAAVAGLRNVPRSSFLKFLDEAGTWRTAKLIGGSR